MHFVVHDLTTLQLFLSDTFPTISYIIKTPLILNSPYYDQGIRSISIFGYGNQSPIKHLNIDREWMFSDRILFKVQSHMLEYGNGSKNEKSFSVNELGINIHTGKIVVQWQFTKTDYFALLRAAAISLAKTFYRWSTLRY